MRGCEASGFTSPLRCSLRRTLAGADVELGEYPLADATYEELLRKLADRKFAGVSPELAKNISDYFGTAEALPNDTSRRHKRSAGVRAQLAALHSQLP